MLEANRLVLEDLEPRIDGELDDESRVEGRVVLEEGAKLERSVVRGPAVIGAGARIVDAYVGPYTSIDAASRCIGSEVEHSILLAGVEVDGPRRRGWRRACSAGTSSSPAARGCRRRCGMLVGDNSEIKIP